MSIQEELEAARNTLGKSQRKRSLTDHQVKMIRTLLREGYTQSSIARIYEVPPSVINQIRHGLTYKDVEGDYSSITEDNNDDSD